MEELFVPYDESEILQSLGFDYLCLAFYSTKDEKLYINNTAKNVGYEVWYIAAPIYSQAFKWFADKYSMYHNIDALFNNKGFRAIIVNTIERDIVIIDTYNTYEEAELECLRKLIEIVKSKN